MQVTNPPVTCVMVSHTTDHRTMGCGNKSNCSAPQVHSQTALFLFYNQFDLEGTVHLMAHC